MQTITINGKDYNCMLKIKTCIQLEKKLGTNPLNVLQALEGGSMPDFETLGTIFHYCLVDMNHGLSMDDSLELFSQYMQENNDSENGGIGSVILLFTKVFQDAGFISTTINFDELEDDTEKNG